jgi:hypothetical protein
MFSGPGSKIGPVEVRRHLDTLDDPFEISKRMEESGYLEEDSPFLSD